MTTLPPLFNVKGLLDANGRSAWERLLEAEKTALALSTNAPVAKHNDLVVAARVIGFFILDFKQHNHGVSFAEYAHHKLVQQVHSCWPSSAGEEECYLKVIELGSQLQNHLIRACMSSVAPSRPILITTIQSAPIRAQFRHPLFILPAPPLRPTKQTSLRVCAEPLQATALRRSRSVLPPDVNHGSLPSRYCLAGSCT
jgi:hypothetical protein